MVCKTFVRLGKCSSCLAEVTFQAGEIDTNYYDQLWNHSTDILCVKRDKKQKGTEKKEDSFGFPEERTNIKISKELAS